MHCIEKRPKCPKSLENGWGEGIHGGSHFRGDAWIQVTCGEATVPDNVPFLKVLGQPAESVVGVLVYCASPARPRCKAG